MAIQRRTDRVKFDKISLWILLYIVLIIFVGHPVPTCPAYFNYTFSNSKVVQPYVIW